MFNWNKKQKPLQGLMGVGGGAIGYLVRGAGGNAPFSGSGGSYTNDPGDGYRYHMFKSGGPTTFTVAEGFNGDCTNVEILVVAGGGGGGNRTGGGGGAGGIAHASSIPELILPTALGGNTITIQVGGGGVAGGQWLGRGAGGDSYFGPGQPFEIKGLGGGAGGTDGGPALGSPGGNGGGGHYADNAGSGNQPTMNPGKPWVANYGNPGNIGYGQSPWESGAGGGAGGSGGDGGPNVRGQSGDGRNFPTFPSPKFCPSSDPWHSALNGRGGGGEIYGGGGGAGSYPPYASLRHPSAASQGGGGNGASGTPQRGGDGIDGTGGGGGGAADGPDVSIPQTFPIGSGFTAPGASLPTTSNAGFGADGLVVIRYQVP